MQVLFPKINHLFGTFVFMIRPYYASKISGEMMHAVSIENNICYDCMMMDFRVMSVKL